jgi:ankyrin repeat protein
MDFETFELNHDLLTSAKVLNLEGIKTAIEKGADIDARFIDHLGQTNGFTPLMFACKNKNAIEVAKYLLDHGADPNARSSSDDSLAFFPLLTAAQSGNMALVKLLFNYGASIDKKVIGKKGLNNLFLSASSSGLTELMRLLIDKISDVNICDPIIKLTPLMLSVSICNIDGIKLLLEHNADINARDYNGKTALMMAVEKYKPRSDYEKIIILLLDKGAKTDVKDNWGRTVFDYARKRRYSRSNKYFTLIDILNGRKVVANGH